MVRSESDSFLAPTPAIDTIVFDLGGVLVDWNPRYLYRKLLPESQIEWFLEHVCHGEWNDAQDAGRSFAEAIQEATARHPEYEKYIRAYHERWEEMLGGAKQDTVRLLEEIKAAGFRVYALSNWSHETFPVAERLYPFLKLFDGKVVSGFERVKKPDPRIFEILQDRFRVEPARAIFIDDVEKNIRAANELGYGTIHFHTAEAARSVLRQLLKQVAK